MMLVIKIIKFTISTLDLNLKIELTNRTNSPTSPLLIIPFE